MKIIKIWDFLNQDENKGKPNFPNLDHEAKNKNKNTLGAKQNPTRFYYKQ